MPTNSELDFKCLCKKLVILFLILGARRKQASTSITVENVILDHDKVILLPNKTLKHSAPNHQFYLGERNCKVDNNNKNLIITYGKPHKNALTDSISRWVKDN